MSFILDYDNNYNMIKTNTNKSLICRLDYAYESYKRANHKSINIKYTILSILQYNVNYKIDDCENIKFQSIIFCTHMSNSFCQYQM